MSQEKYNMGDVDAPENQEKEYLKPGYHKLTVKGFEYKKEDEGKTPLIVLTLEKVSKDGGEPITLKENFYMSGKIKDGKMNSVIRIQELAMGLTGSKITIQPSLYNYTKKNSDGTTDSFSIPNPKEITDYLNKNCTGKSAIFKVGGEQDGEGSDAKIYSKLTYSGFLYYTDKQKNLCRYKEERDFTESEYKYAVQKKKDANAPAGGGGVATTTKMDEL